MRRKLLFVLSVMATIVSMAADVTPQQALQEAQRFMQQRATASGRRAAATTQLELASRVSDLYVFNISGGQGFVIISNDDCAETVLGYSDTGTFDPNNIPDNMRAWLQGYADEIAWAKSHNIQKTAGSASRRTSAVKTAIAPLMQTQWNQGAPYNNLCPYYYDNGSDYVYSASYISGYEHCATGCVATALAQVMYYNQWPTSATTAIPSYTWENASVTLEGLSPTTFDWGNMQTTYPATGTEEEVNAANTAIATLMKYCGYSVEMNYGESSGAGSSMTADALKTYFDYETTASSENRSYYTYSNWIELLYNELNQGRVVLYHGNSTGGGHAFVCDGYQTEDYFHINWGWGGTSDGHFKLSAMDPDAQGIGGSSSTDGFNYLQGAVVGIQKKGDTGTVLNLKQTPSLQINSVSLSRSTITYGESVDVTFNVTNQNNYDYDGEIYVYLNGRGVKAGKTFQIPANESKNCTITFTPTGFTGTITVYAALPTGNGGWYYQENSRHAQLTVNNGGGSNPRTTNLTLNRSLTAENAVIISGKSYNIYGKKFNGTLTVSNPSAEYDYDGYYQYDLWQYSDHWEHLDYKSSHVVIAAGSSVDIPIEWDEMVYGTMFEVDVTYYNTSVSGYWMAQDEVAYFYPQPAITTTNESGVSTVIAPSGNSFAVPSGTLSVDLTSTGITTVTGAEPNCIFIKGSADAAITGATNVITYDGANYTASNITLTDGSGFYSPVDFTATSVEFTFNNDRWADGSKGWNTIMLPFDVTSVTADDTAIDWFHSSSDTGKQFWLKEFTSDGASTVNFDYTDAMKANTPYIIALPGNHWGSNWDLSGKTIKFIGENTTVYKGGTLSTITGSNYRFMGNTVQDNTENIYAINNVGNSFELKATGGCAPFRAFFKPGTFDRSVTSLGIGNGANTTGIKTIKSEEIKDKSYFNLNGQRVAQPTKGLYIMNGKKYVVK